MRGGPLSQLLAEMDGFDRSVAVVILAATNRPEVLDPALLRAGRTRPAGSAGGIKPEKKGRMQILAVHLKKLPLAAGVIDLEEIAAMTPGFTGADLANLANEAAVHATRRDAESIAMIDFTEAIERIVAGLEKRSRVLIPKERRVVAYHEMGHALVALALPGTDPVQKISIIPRGIGALEEGYDAAPPPATATSWVSSEARGLGWRTSVGGRAAEMMLGADVTTGAADDIAKATDIARGMVMRFGMDMQLGPVALDYLTRASSCR